MGEFIMIVVAVAIGTALGPCILYAAADWLERHF